MLKMGLLVFARCSSKRLPNKVMKKVAFNSRLIEIIISRLKKILNVKIIICTSDSKTDDKIFDLCKEKKIECFRGSLDNVFDRTVNCLKKYKIKSFVRVNSDRPFVDSSEIKKMIKVFNKNKFDIVTNQLSKTCPKGLACEIANSKIFFNSLNLIRKKKDKEHIFNFFYNNKKNYKIFNLKNKIYEQNKKKKLSIDTYFDLVRAKKIFMKFDNINVSTLKVLNFLKKNEI